MGELTAGFFEEKFKLKKCTAFSTNSNSLHTSNIVCLLVPWVYCAKYYCVEGFAYIQKGIGTSFRLLPVWTGIPSKLSSLGLVVGLDFLLLVTTVRDLLVVR